jgi:hypothetical protein
VLDLVLQLGPCRVEPVGRRLLRVRGGSDQPAVVAAIRRAGGERDGTREFWWMEARNLCAFATSCGVCLICSSTLPGGRAGTEHAHHPQCPHPVARHAAEQRRQWRSSWQASSRRPSAASFKVACMRWQRWLGSGWAWRYISLRGLCSGGCDDVGSGADLVHHAGRRGADPGRRRSLAGEAHAVRRLHGKPNPPGGSGPVWRGQ